MNILCTVCGSVFEEWFDACPDCADRRRQRQVKSTSEIMQNICEEHRCPHCHRSAALKVYKCIRLDGSHYSRRHCHHKDCRYHDEVNYWPEDIREW